MKPLKNEHYCAYMTQSMFFKFYHNIFNLKQKPSHRNIKPIFLLINLRVKLWSTFLIKLIQNLAIFFIKIHQDGYQNVRRNNSVNKR